MLKVWLIGLIKGEDMKMKDLNLLSVFFLGIGILLNGMSYLLLFLSVPMGIIAPVYLASNFMIEVGITCFVAYSLVKIVFGFNNLINRLKGVSS